MPPTGPRERGVHLATWTAVGALAGLLARDLGLPGIFSYWHDRTPLVLACALLFALLSLTRLRFVGLAGTLALFALWLAVLFSPLVPRLAEGLPRRDALDDKAPPADAVFVLSSRLQLDGELGASSMPRLLRALELAGEGR